jgi:eukaryotic-like serine/threonine-protein kinase
VFHSRPKSLAGLYRIDTEGGKPEPLTSELGNNISPSWSHGGKWIYFASRRTGQIHVWKIPVTGGAATQVSEQSGWCPLESKDGRFLYYVTMPGGTLRAVPLSGGPEREVLTGLAGYGTAYAPATHGIYLIRKESPGQKQELVFFDFVSQHITTLVEIPKPVRLGLALSPEEDVILYSQVDHRSSGLMLVDNFR